MRLNPVCRCPSSDRSYTSITFSRCPRSTSAIASTTSCTGSEIDEDTSIITRRPSHHRDECEHQHRGLNRRVGLDDPAVRSQHDEHYDSRAWERRTHRPHQYQPCPY